MQLLSRAKTFQERLKNDAKLDIRMKLGKVYTSEYVRKYMKYVIIILKRLVSIFVLHSCSNEKKKMVYSSIGLSTFLRVLGSSGGGGVGEGCWGRCNIRRRSLCVSAV